MVQDVRGKGHSTGFYDAFANDIEDGYDTVEGLAKEPWSNGRIGITGASAMGITSNLAAVASPPHLKAAYVIVAPNETFRTSFLGGVPQDKDLAGWLRGQGVSEEVIRQSQARSVRNVFADRLGPGTSLKYVDIPIWNVGGWYDIFNTGSVENFETLQHHGARGARGNQRLTMGPFGHGDLSGDLAYPGQDRLGAGDERHGQGQRRPLVRPLAEGRRERRDGRAAGGGLHDGFGAQGRLLRQEPLDQGRRLAARQPPGLLPPQQGHGPERRRTLGRGGEGLLPLRPQEPRAHPRRRPT